MIAQAKEYIWFIDDESDQLPYLIYTYGHSYLKPKLEELKRDMIDVQDRLVKSQCQYQDAKKN